MYRERTGRPLTSDEDRALEQALAESHFMKPTEKAETAFNVHGILIAWNYSCRILQYVKTY